MPNWSDVLLEISRTQAKRAGQAQGAVDLIRRSYLKKLRNHTGRNIIAYYSGFLSKPDILQADINDEDKNGFMMAVHRIPRKLGLDLILHTPGGSVAATQSIVDYLHKMFGRDIRAIVPQIAMSAGTMLACSTRSIVLSKHSNLGPIDPHVSGVPAYGVIKEFQDACADVQKQPSNLPLWEAIIGQYRPAFLGQCQNAIDWSNAFVAEQLENVMFEGQSDAKQKATNIVDKLTDYSGNKTHSRHIHMDECISMGLVIEKLEDDPVFQDLLLTVHHCYMHSLMNTASYKMIENHVGTAMVKQARVMSG
jgi:hypothetical protein